MSLDDEYADMLARLAERMHVQEDTQEGLAQARRGEAISLDELASSD